jgi:hypothetical protein
MSAPGAGERVCDRCGEQPASVFYRDDSPNVRRGKALCIACYRISNAPTFARRLDTSVDPSATPEAWTTKTRRHPFIPAEEARNRQRERLNHTPDAARHRIGRRPRRDTSPDFPADYAAAKQNVMETGADLTQAAVCAELQARGYSTIGSDRTLRSWLHAFCLSWP